MYQPILSGLAPNISKSFDVEDNKYGLLYLSNGPNIKKSQYLYPPINPETDITFITTNVFADKFGIDVDINLLCMTSSRISLRDNKKECKLALIAIIPETRNIQSNVILSDDIWTDDFEHFESLISEFAANSSMLSNSAFINASFLTDKETHHLLIHRADIKVCVVDIEPFGDDQEEKSEESEELNFESIDIVQIKFVNNERLGILAKLKYGINDKPNTCLLTINFKKLKEEFDFQDNVKFTDYEMAINELIFDYSIIPSSININDLNKYLFGKDIDGQELSVCGSRKLAAIACDPSRENDKCNRLIVLDINVDDDEEDEDEDESETAENEVTEIQNESDSYSSGNEDSDLRKIVDID